MSDLTILMIAMALGILYVVFWARVMREYQARIDAERLERWKHYLDYNLKEKRNDPR